MGCGEMSEADFTAFLKTVFALLVENYVDGSVHQICMDWRHMGEMLGAGCQVYTYSRRDSNLTFFAFASDLQEAIACLSTTCSAFDNFFSWAKAGTTVTPPRNAVATMLTNDSLAKRDPTRNITTSLYYTCAVIMRFQGSGTRERSLSQLHDLVSAVGQERTYGGRSPKQAVVLGLDGLASIWRN
jgi:hypothetical protein